MLDIIYSHANFVLSEDLYEVFKKELLDNNCEVLAFDIEISVINKKDKHPDNIIKEDKNILMSDISKIRRFVSLRSSNIKYIISNKKLLNTAIQEGILKLLEEASENIRFVFFTDTTDYILPTILSRCVVYREGDFPDVIFDRKNNNNRSEDYNSTMDLLNKNIELFVEKGRYKDLEKLLNIKNELNSNNLSTKYVKDYLGIV